MPATRYMTPRESIPRRAPPKPVDRLDRHPARRFWRSIGSVEVGGAIITALVSGLVATGLGWLAADLF